MRMEKPSRRMRVVSSTPVYCSCWRTRGGINFLGFFSSLGLMQLKEGGKKIVLILEL